MPVVRTRQEAAEILGITPRVLSLWARDTWFPADATEQDGRGRRINWNTDAIAAARDAMGRKGSEPAETARRLKLATDQEKLKQAELATRSREIDLAVKEGALIPRYAVELHFATLLTELGDWCNQIPDLVSADVCRKCRRKLRARVADELNRRRHELAAELQRAARELDARPAAGG
ncbi:MAG TPA: hypothetical protein VML55_00345 [Planctomycetaceae bacterium]|nr:hypothetical protein [Planctomycetaceae bacterium]